MCNPVASVRRDQLDRFFEPFWRQSDSRSERSHLGLGLTLAHRLAQAMGGDLTADLIADGTLRVRLSIPTRATAAGAGRFT